MKNTDSATHSALIIVPTYNEADNIEKLINEIEKAGSNKFDILFIDDNSPDGTGKLVEKIKLAKSNIFAIHRRGKMGLGSAYLVGFRYGIEKDYEYIFEMDADLSHSPEYLIPMLGELDNFDVVIGSRFMGGLQNINKTPLRILISMIAARYIKLILRLKCKDPMAGFVGYRKRVLKSLDYSNFLAKGYMFQAEVKYECEIRGFEIDEIPIIFKNRNLGESKISKKDMIEALVLPWKIRFLKNK